MSLIVLDRAYRAHSLGARLHVLIRYLTCPFSRVLRAIPRDALSLLEIGAGHGVFSTLAAARGVSRVVAVEPDLRKMQRVDAIAQVAGFDDAIRGTFDVVAMLDILYAIPIADWDALLDRAFARLTPGGTLIIKEQDPAAKVKNAWNRAQEWLSEKFLGITMANAFNYETREVFIARLQRHGFREVTSRRIDFGYPHPHVLYVARK
jgi:2-polyprenyl-3-methyl-5-hydroxy-6-metoxy-1,4-benzoquinol methylase